MQVTQYLWRFLKEERKQSTQQRGAAERLGFVCLKILYLQSESENIPIHYSSVESQQFEVYVGMLMQVKVIISLFQTHLPSTEMQCTLQSTLAERIHSYYGSCQTLSPFLSPHLRLLGLVNGFPFHVLMGAAIFQPARHANAATVAICHIQDTELTASTPRWSAAVRRCVSGSDKVKMMGSRSWVRKYFIFLQ